MFRYKPNNKQAMIIAVLTILLCLVCLCGVSLALFTSINDGTIGVVATAGNIDVDIVDVDTGESLVDKTLGFYGGVDALFEPGATFFTEGFKIRNTGDIPINFRVYVSEDERVDMTEFNEAFDVWMITDINAPDEGTRLTEFTGSLQANGKSSEKTYYLAIKMREDAGNTFQGKDYTGIGVTVYATQGNVDVHQKEDSQ